MIAVELWAQQALSRPERGKPSLAEQANDPTIEEFHTELVESLLRAAYSLGYLDGLGDPDPLTYAEAIARRDQLLLMLPVA